MNNYDVMIGKSNITEGRLPYLVDTIMADSKHEAIETVMKECEIHESYKSEMFAFLSGSTLDK